MRIRRTFSQEFKREIAEAIVSGKATQLELSRRYDIQPVIISKWKKEYYAGKFFENKSTDYARFEIRIKELERMVGRLTMENDTLKEIVKLVEPQKKSLAADIYISGLGSIKEGCKMTGVIRSKYYYKPKKDKLDDTFMLDKIAGIALSFPSYGYRRITAHLRREDITINHKKVYRIMKANGICCSIRRSYKHTTNSNHSLAKYPNLIKDLVPVRLNHIWHADITYIRFAVSFA